jgi:hypothetical protein
VHLWAAAYPFGRGRRRSDSPRDEPLEAQMRVKIDLAARLSPSAF